MDRLFIFGFGFSSQAVARKAQSGFENICGTTRSTEKKALIFQSGFDAEYFAGTVFSVALRKRLENCTHLLISIAPGEQDPVLLLMKEEGLKNICPNLRWVGYLSTVGVYGNHDGAWVNEETVPKPVSRRSLERISAEQGWTMAAGVSGLPLAIFRLSGIFGPGRNAFITIQKGKARRLVKPGQVFNRIHCDDIATAVVLAMADDVGGIFNITDDQPAPPQDVIAYAHELMGIAPPPEIDFDAADLTAMARSFYGENKRVGNAKSKTVLGMKYMWPDYRTSLRRMWENGSWQAAG